MKIGFVTDTNILRSGKNTVIVEKDYLKTTDVFNDYVENLNQTKSNSTLTYFMPEIILEELNKQQKDAYDSRYEGLKKDYEKMSYGMTGIFPESNYTKIQGEEIDLYSKKLKILKLTYTEELFNEIVQKAIRKMPPFDEKGAGLKDELIWQTILNSKDIDDCNLFYFFTSDNDFISYIETFKTEFTRKHPNTKLEIIKPDNNLSKRQDCLMKIISDNSLYEDGKIKLYNQKRILESINHIKYDNDSNTPMLYFNQKITLQNIEFDSFGDNDFNIVDVNQDESGDFIVFIEFETKKFMIDTNILPEHISLSGTINLKYNNNLEFVSSEIKNIHFTGVSVYDALSNSIGLINLKKFSEYLSAFQTNAILNNSLQPFIDSLQNNPIKQEEKQIEAFSKALSACSPYEMSSNNLTSTIKSNDVGKNDQ